MATGGGGQNLGGATYTLTANTAPFTAALSQAQQQATQTTQVIASSFNGLLIIPRQLAAINQSIVSLGNNLQGVQRQAAAFQGAGGAAFGGFGSSLMMVAQTVDDIQYGFRAIVNQIPMLATGAASALGASTQSALAFGGAVGVIAVGINQVSQHWEEWFSTADKLPNLTQDVDQLGRALGQINPQLDELIKRKEEAAKPVDMGNLWGLTKEKFGAFDQEKLDKLKELQVEAKKRIREEKDLESTGPEHTKEARDVGKRVRDAIAEMPEGSDTLMGMLAARGMGHEKAREAVSQAARGHSGYLNDILGVLTPEEKRRGMFAGLANATPQAIKRDEEIKAAIKEGEEQARFTEKQFEDEKRKAKHDQGEARRGQRQAMEDNHTARKRRFEDRGDALQDREHAVRKEMRNKPFKGSYFDYATSHGDASIEKKQLDKLDAIKVEMRQLDTEKKAEQRAFEDRMKTFARQILGMGD